MKMKSKGYAGGGKMKTKGYQRGGKMPMAKDPRTGEMKPAFLVDEKGMKMGGVAVPKTKGYFKGGKTMASNMATKGTKHSNKMG